jgi:trehalose transport system permease protein
MFTYLFGNAGYLNELLHRLGVIDIPIDWLGGDWRSLGVILLAELWKVTPIVTLILLAGLESVPESALEAAAANMLLGMVVLGVVSYVLLMTHRQGGAS